MKKELEREIRNPLRGRVEETYLEPFSDRIVGIPKVLYSVFPIRNCLLTLIGYESGNLTHA
jgi:hypothetical protein